MLCVTLSTQVPGQWLCSVSPRLSCVSWEGQALCSCRAPAVALYACTLCLYACALSAFGFPKLTCIFTSGRERRRFKSDDEVGDHLGPLLSSSHFFSLPQISSVSPHLKPT